ncbi:hypothetical protein BC830DRAFT_1115278 [Chytriomyces sp. MP71]|nr:hypothetical protein BC830DRAFT_1115278 [Chytriomyces sp. MP71]
MQKTMRTETETTKRANAKAGATVTTRTATTVVVVESSPPTATMNICETEASPGARVFLATVVHSLSLGHLEVIQRAAVGVDPLGRIAFVADQPSASSASSQPGHPSRHFPAPFEKAEVVDLGERILIPGFVDGHAHAPQFSFIGIGMHLPLLEWLSAYTFPNEAKFADAEYAARHYRTAVSRHLSNGTTTCSYFATVHLESTKVLADIVRELGQRGLVGKVNMDRNSPEALTESTDASLADTQAFINYVHSLNTPLVQPVITPRFVPSASSSLMSGLAALSAAHTPKIHVQSHLSENKNEVAWVRDLHPSCDSYTHVYDTHGLLHERTYMAHCIWCTRDERALLRARGAAIIHCPNSNFSLSSGALNVRRLLREGVKVGLGTDVSGGYSPSILDAIRQAVVASKMVSIGLGSGNEPLVQGAESSNASAESYDALTFAEAFHLATVGGAESLDLQDKIGNFLVGKDFDALVVNPRADKSPVDVFEGDSVLDVFQRFLFLGDDRNIEQVYVAGKRCK